LARLQSWQIEQSTWTISALQPNIFLSRPQKSNGKVSIQVFMALE